MLQRTETLYGLLRNVLIDADVVRKVQKLRFSPDDFQSIQVIGRGEFGEVHLVCHNLAICTV